MLAQHAAGLELDDLAGLLAQVPAQKVVVIDLAKEADALAVLATRVGQARLQSYAAHLALGEIADRECDVAQLFAGDAGQEVCLVFDRVDSRSEPFAALGVGFGRGIVAAGRQVELMAPALLEEAELDDQVAHHVGVGRQAGADSLQGVFHHILPVLVVQRHYVERQTVAGGDQTAHLDVLLVRTVTETVVAADTYVEQMHVVTLLDKPVNGHGRVYASRYQCSYFHSMSLETGISIPSWCGVWPMRRAVRRCRSSWPAAGGASQADRSRASGAAGNIRLRRPMRR